MQHTDQPVQTDVTPAQPADRKPRLVHMAQLPASGDLLPRIRRYLMMRPVALGAVCLVLILHWALPGPFDFTTVLLLAGLYLLLLGSGGLEAARLSGGGDARRQERLAEDALRRAGRLQSHLEPGTATDEVWERILSSGHDPRRALLLAGNEVEDALRAVYRHFAENERLAGTSTGADLPLAFMVQELIWRGLLAPDIYDTAEPVLALREMALAPRTHIEQQTARDAARAAQAIVLRVESLGIDIRPRRVPLAWMRNEHAFPRLDPAATTPRPENTAPAPAEPPVVDAPVTEDGSATLRFPRTLHDEHPNPQVVEVQQHNGATTEAARPDVQPQEDGPDPADPIAP